MPKQTGRPTKLHFSICITILFFVGVILLICWLSLRPHGPKIHVHDFAILGAGQTETNNGFKSTRIVYNVSVRNPNQRVWISYATLTTVLYHNGQLIGSTPSFSSFDQEPKNTLYIDHVLTGDAISSGSGDDRWMDIMMNDGGEGRVEFGLELKSSLRYEKTMWDLRRHNVHAKCEVPVGKDGSLLPAYQGKECTL
ncbi:NDR1/HIN1-like protein 3 [Linum grandiflorum]